MKIVAPSQRYDILNQVSIALYGPGTHTANLSALRALAGKNHSIPLNRVCLVKSPSNADFPGFKTIVSADFGTFSDDPNQPNVFAEGVVLSTPNSAVVIQTADCPVLVLYDSDQHKLVATHAGRAAMTPTIDPQGNIGNIVTIAYQALVNGSCARHPLYAYITGAISAKNFKHDHATAQKLVRPFFAFGKVAFEDSFKGTLDLVSIITKQLTELRVAKENIVHDNLCTYDTPWLASYRRNPGTTERNAIIVALK